MKLRFALTFAIALTLEAGLMMSAAAQTAAAIATPVATDSKRALAAKLVALQNGPEMERMTLQLTTSAIQRLLPPGAVPALIPTVNIALRVNNCRFTFRTDIIRSVC